MNFSLSRNIPTSGDHLSEQLCRATFLDPTEYNSVPGFHLECEDQNDSVVYAFWVFSATLAAVSAGLGLIKVCWYGWTRYRFGHGLLLEQTQQWVAKWLVSCITITIFTGLYVYTSNIQALQAYMVILTSAQCYFAYSILDALSPEPTTKTDFMLKVTHCILTEITKYSLTG